MQVNFNFSQERFSEELAKLGSAKEIAASTGISEQSLSALKRGKSEASNATLSKIQSIYPSFDPIYVLTGIRNVLDLSQKVSQLEGELNEVKRRENAHLVAIERMALVGKDKGTDIMPEFIDQEGASEMLTEAVFFGVLNGTENPMSQEWTEGFGL